MKNLFIALSLLISAAAFGGEFVERTLGGMPYLLFVPPNAPARYPLVLWMHGGGARGSDPQKIISFGDTTGPLYFGRDDIQRRYPSIVVAPLCSIDRFWTDEWQRVFAIVDEVRKRYPVDSSRVYVVGMSMGGYAAWDLIARRPDLFAAAMPICGGGNPSRAKQIARTPVWAFHGVLDDRVDVDESRRMIAAVTKAGGKPRYSEYPDEEHNVWHRAFKEPEFLTWLFAQRKLPTVNR